MTKEFIKAFQDVIMIEKGYVNDPVDRGGETKYGISKKSYPHLDIPNLTMDQARDIYFKDYWEKAGCDHILKYEIAAEIFDTAVNAGPGTAIKFLQSALNLMNRNQSSYPDIAVDGGFGPVTLSTYKKVDDKVLLKVLNGLQFMHYVNTCEGDPEQERFFNGWMKRV